MTKIVLIAFFGSMFSDETRTTTFLSKRLILFIVMSTIYNYVQNSILGEVNAIFELSETNPDKAICWLYCHGISGTELHVKSKILAKMIVREFNGRVKTHFIVTEFE